MAEGKADLFSGESGVSVPPRANDQRGGGERRHQAYLEALGARVRKLRKERGLSLDELSARSELSKSMLSMVERGQANCTISSVIGIASAFGVPISELFEPVLSSEPVIRRDDLSVAYSKEGERRIYAYNGARDVEVSENLYKAKAMSSPIARSHSGWECGIVIQGALEMEIGGQSHVLEVGDCFAFDSHNPHRFYNPSNSWTRIIWVNMVDGSGRTQPNHVKDHRV